MASRAPAVCSGGCKKRPNAIFKNFTIGMPMGKSYLSVDATLDPTYVTAKLERDVHKHASKAKELGMQFMPIAFTTYGGMGDEFLKKRWRVLQGVWRRSSRRAAKVGRRASDSSAPSRSSQSS